MLRLKKSQMEELDITAVCAYCEYAQRLVGGDDMLCRLNGVVSGCHTCKKFRYDLLKRRPAKPASALPSVPLPSLDDDDPSDGESL